MDYLPFHWLPIITSHHLPPSHHPSIRTSYFSSSFCFQGGITRLAPTWAGPRVNSDRAASRCDSITCSVTHRSFPRYSDASDSFLLRAHDLPRLSDISPSLAARSFLRLSFSLSPWPFPSSLRPYLSPISQCCRICFALSCLFVCLSHRLSDHSSARVQIHLLVLVLLLIGTGIPR